MLMDLGLTIFEMGLLRVGLLFSEVLLLSGGHYYRDLTSSHNFSILLSGSCPYFCGVMLLSSSHSINI